VKGRIKELEKLYPDLEDRVVHVVNQYGEEGQKIAAETFGLSQPSISTFLRKRGYKRTVQYVKLGERAS
jgi:hypothetical protein